MLLLKLVIVSELNNSPWIHFPEVMYPTRILIISFTYNIHVRIKKPYSIVGKRWMVSFLNVIFDTSTCSPVYPLQC